MLLLLRSYHDSTKDNLNDTVAFLSFLFQKQQPIYPKTMARRLIDGGIRECPWSDSNRRSTGPFSDIQILAGPGSKN